MIQLPDHIHPAPKTLETLKKYQSDVDIQPTFEARSDLAKNIFPKRNKKHNSAFNDVKKALTLMCSGTRRCVYCEDSVADEVEHICPKDLYPELCFVWLNYVYACGTCNGPKSNKFAIFRSDNGLFQSVRPLAGQKTAPPPQGMHVLINPRIENPMDYCILDLSKTFKFVILAPDGTDEHKRADYAFNEVLRLNDEEKEYLRKARKNAYDNYSSRLYRYHDRKSKGASQTELEKIIEGIREESHPTVWREIQRYHKEGWLLEVDQTLDQMLIACPEALTW